MRDTAVIPTERIVRIRDHQTIFIDRQGAPERPTHPARCQTETSIIYDGVRVGVYSPQLQFPWPFLDQRARPADGVRDHIRSGSVEDQRSIVHHSPGSRTQRATRSPITDL